MGLFDRIRKKHEDVGKDKKPTHAKDVAPKADEVQAVDKLEKKEAPKDEKKHVKPRVLKSDTRNAHRVLIRPVLTEKTTRLTSNNQYVFAVPRGVGKIEVREAVYATYGVRPIRVTTSTVHGKLVRFGRLSGNQKTWKKAVVTLPAGKTIDVSN